MELNKERLHFEHIAFRLVPQFVTFLSADSMTINQRVCNILIALETTCMLILRIRCALLCTKSYRSIWILNINLTSRKDQFATLNTELNLLTGC